MTRISRFDLAGFIATEALGRALGRWGIREATATPTEGTMPMIDDIKNRIARAIEHLEAAAGNEDGEKDPGRTGLAYAELVLMRHEVEELHNYVRELQDLELYRIYKGIIEDFASAPTWPPPATEAA